MIVYVTMLKEESVDITEIKVWKTKEDAVKYMNDTVESILTHEHDLYELYRGSERHVSIGFKDVDGKDTCAYYIRVLERIVEHYSEEDLKEMGS